MKRSLVVGLGLVGTFVIGVAVGLSIDTERPATKHLNPLAKPKESADIGGYRDDNFRRFTSVADTLQLPRGFSQTEALFVLAGRSGVQGLAKLIEEATDLADTELRNVAINILILRLTELDPPSALKAVKTSKLTSQRQMVQTIISAWARKDFSSAKAAALEIPDRDSRRLALMALVRNGPALTREQKQELAKEFGLPANTVVSMPSQWRNRLAASEDPRAAMAEALQTKNAEQRHFAVSRAAALWARHDPGQAFEYVKKMDNGRTRDSLVDTVLQQWAEQDPEKAFAKWSDLPAGKAKRDSISGVFTRWAKSDPVAAVAAAEGMGHEQDKQIALAHVVADWALQDAPAAMNYVETVANRTQRENLANNILVNFATVDPDLSIKWARTIDGDKNVELLGRVLQGIASLQPERTLEEALSVEWPEQRRKLLHDVLPTIARDDPKLAARYVDTATEQSDTSELLLVVSSSWAQSDPDAAFMWLMGKNGVARIDALSKLSESIAEHNLDAALRLLPQVPEEARHGWLGGIATQMAASDAQRAAAWVDEHRSDAAYPDMARAVAVQLVYSDRPASIKLVQSIAAGEPRHQAYVDVIRQLAISSPIAARELLQDAKLPLRYRQQVEDYINSR